MSASRRRRATEARSSHAQVTLNVQGARPNTTFTVERFVAEPPDGICTEAGGGLIHGTFVLQRAEQGHFERVAPGEMPGSQFDIDFHVVGDDATALMSSCMTVTMK
jgi:hypothetical protein